MNSRPGCFVTVEGIEGAGKSSNLHHVERLLTQAGLQVLFTREPGGTPLGEEIRNLLLTHREDGIHGDAELLLMFAARAEHLAKRILPALERGIWVLCDRFTDATYAYQGAGRGISAERIALLENWVQGDLRPDLTLLLDLPVDLGLARAGRRSAPDRFERESIHFFQSVREAYRRIAAQEPSRVRLVDAAPELSQVQAQLTAIVNDFIKDHAGKD